MERYILAVLEGDLAAFEEVHETTGGGDQQMAATVQLPHLVRHIRPTVHHAGAHLIWTTDDGYRIRKRGKGKRKRTKRGEKENGVYKGKKRRNEDKKKSVRSRDYRLMLLPVLK
jgi:hypothetical protein